MAEVAVRAPRRRPSRGVNPLGLVVLVGLFGVWELAVATSIVRAEYVPAPSAALGSLVDLFRSGALVENTRHTVVVTLVGWAIAAVLGVALGAALGLLPRVHTGTMASFEALRAVPMVAFVPLAVLVLGFTTTMEVVVAAYAAVWPVLLHTISGLRSPSARLLEVGQVLRLGRLDVVRKIRLPAAVPFVLVGLRLAMAMSLILALVAEMIGNPAGMGAAMVRAGQSLRPDEVFGYIIAVGLLGIALNAVLVALGRLAFRGALAAADDG